MPPLDCTNSDCSGPTRAFPTVRQTGSTPGNVCCWRRVKVTVPTVHNGPCCWHACSNSVNYWCVSLRRISQCTQRDFFFLKKRGWGREGEEARTVLNRTYPAKRVCKLSAKLNAFPAQGTSREFFNNNNGNNSKTINNNNNNGGNLQFI